jgi:4-amino-4-deoxy-L-arabinose transferase-like glycosyltransferase
MAAETNLPQTGLKRDHIFEVLALISLVILDLAFRLPGLTVFLTADEARSWFGRSIIFLDSLVRLDLANTGPGGTVPFIENVSLSPAPGVTTMWLGAAGIGLAYLSQGLPGSLSQFLRSMPFDPLDPAMLFWLRLPNVLLSTTAVAVTYWWSRSLLGRWGALVAAAFLALDPFYLALSRVLGHDAPVTTFMWLSLLVLLAGVQPMLAGPNRSAPPESNAFWAQRRFLLPSGALAGLAFLSKYPALFLGGFAGLTLLLVYLGQAPLGQWRQMVWPWGQAMLLWTVAAGLTFFLFWPAMWLEPLAPLTAIVSDAWRVSAGAHPKGSFFLGQPVPDPGALFYPVIILLRTSPVIFLGLLLALWWLKPGQRPAAPTALILLAYTLCFTLLVTYGGKKQDRYILPAFPALMMLASLGYGRLARGRLARPPYSWLIPLGLIALQALLIRPYAPYYFSYYNPLAGGGAAASRLVQVGWGEGLDQAAAYLNALPDAESIKVVAWYSTTFEPYFKGQALYKVEDEKISRSTKPGLAADYVIIYVNQVQRELPSAGALQYFRAVPPVHTVTLHGLDYAWVYPSRRIAQLFPGEIRLVGQGELLGFDLTTEAGAPARVAYPESVVILSLYWEWQGKAADEPIHISLVDESGTTRGWGNPIETSAPLPFDQWQEGMVVRDDFALVIFPDTAPGHYRLAAWIDRPATGETVGVFPLGDQVLFEIVPRGQE